MKIYTELHTFNLADNEENYINKELFKYFM